MRQTQGLAEFLTARLAEDEERAKVVAEPTHWPWLEQRMLREVAAKRQILALHERQEWHGNAGRPRKPVRYYCECQAPDGVIYGEWPCETVSALAAVYSDHPDYDADTD